MLLSYTESRCSVCASVDSETIRRSFLLHSYVKLVFMMCPIITWLNVPPMPEGTESKYLFSFRSLTYREICYIIGPWLAFLGPLHQIFMFFRLLSFFLSTMGWMEVNSSTVRSSVGCLAFNFSIAVLDSSFLWRSLGRRSCPRTKQPLTYCIHKAFSLLNLFSECHAWRLKRVELGPCYHMTCRCGNMLHHNVVQEYTSLFAFVLGRLLYCSSYMRTWRLSVSQRVYWLYSLPIAGQLLGCDLDELFGLMVYPLMS